ncbi:MAG: 23S rRNA (adenine(2503)-C(2))-methyltransferase RlmN [Chloroflexi bacterium]|nr:23S rRNA (adenine(2503)-C(2))-methyltransferase RlmN [Chloroflexota bacterium]
MINLLDLRKDELTDLLTGWGFARYRADQVWTWLYTHKVTDFGAMHNLPGDLVEQLESEARIGGLETVRDLLSNDGETRKYLFRLPDGQLIETVLMAYDDDRRTACISSQAGCAMGCVFCATGQMGFARNLTTGEIVEQALHVARVLEAEDDRLSNVVMMGMGEPFHNYDNTLEAVRRLNTDLGIGQRHITVSTVGLVPAIDRFAEEDLQVRLAISLHAATDEERSDLLPVNRRYPIGELMDSVRRYIDRTGRRVTFEWALIAHENDTPEEAHALGELLEGLLCHVNVIPLNPTAGYTGHKPDRDRVDRFAAILKSYGIPATIRVRRGIDINAGCGQLKTDVLREGQA